MVEIVKFVYVIIIFISLFLGANVEGRIKCKEDSGCQNELYLSLLKSNFNSINKSKSMMP
ncbi:putative Late nodulin [Medicago truncatula]|uniref:Putative Late nodulin n=1 Tax=Medicago truncatula TaxID=3880 RepID=A0A396IU76_MEDTR|nr:putative Late nodulin [Medicago truncatula]